MGALPTASPPRYLDPITPHRGIISAAENAVTNCASEGFPKLWTKVIASFARGYRAVQDPGFAV